MTHLFVFQFYNFPSNVQHQYLRKFIFKGIEKEDLSSYFLEHV
jgi:hypothetical protein